MGRGVVCDGSRDGVADVVRKQAEIGLDVPSDGEFGKLGWNNYVGERFGGLKPSKTVYAGRLRSVSKDRTQFADFYNTYTRFETIMWLPEELRAEPTAETSGLIWEVDGPITYTGQAAIERDIANFKAAMQAAGVEEGSCRWSRPGAPSPGS